MFSENQLYVKRRYNILNNLQSQVNPKVLNSITSFNFLYTTLFNKNFNQNTLTYYLSFYNLNTMGFFTKTRSKLNY